MKSGPFHIARAIPSQQYRDSRIAIIVPPILKHTQLKQAVRHFLLSQIAAASVEELDFDATALQTIPELPHLRRYGSHRQRSLDGTVGARQTQQVIEMDANPIARQPTFTLLGKTLSLVKYVGIVPVYEHPFHFRGSSVLSGYSRSS